MKIFVKEILVEPSNTYQGMPVRIDACCPNSMIWMVRHSLNYNMQEAMFIQKDTELPEETNVYINCQFCGSRHETIKIEEPKQEEVKNKQNI